jgi:uncharacterized protein
MPMGYVDADTHVIEDASTWSFFDPGEREYAPDAGATTWMVEDFTVNLVPGPPSEEYRRTYPAGTRELTDVAARLAHMDEMAVDVQVMFSTFWLMHDLSDPVREAAMHRSWNRWAAERSGEAGGRLRWLCQAPMRDLVRTREELVGVETTGVRYGMVIGHKAFWPVFELLQDLDMTLAVHVGGSNHSYFRHPQAFYYNHILPVPGAFHNLIGMDVPTRFPRLRIAFCEAGGSWVPHALSEKFRTNDRASARVWGDWRPRAEEYLASANLYVSLLLDDDMAYLASYIGEDRIMVGSDYSHIDAGTDPDALRIAARRTDLAPDVLAKLLEDNTRRCYGIA